MKPNTEMRIAMWSGPRNLSTALMYSFASRADFAVWDEPFYAAYLKSSGADHPMKDEIQTAHECDAQRIASRCAGPILGGKRNLYMKHMAHHMCDGFPLDWAMSCTNVHLIRHPARVIASYNAKRQTVTMEDIGFAAQTAIYDQLGGVVVDSADILAHPEKTLRLLCDAIGLAFDPAMLTWAAGPIPEDGIWACHWYGAVHKSTGFAGSEGPLPVIAQNQASIMKDAMTHYARLRRAAIW